LSSIFRTFFDRLINIVPKKQSPADDLEPEYLPTPIPICLLTGSQGIGIGSKSRNYFPDFYHIPTNTIVEVKSKYTMGLAESNNREVLRMVKAKARACIKSGYNFKLMLMDATGSLIPLPEDWLSMDKRKINRYIIGNEK
jgi:hypothetical protein